PAVVLQVHVVGERDVEERAGTAVIGEGILRVVDLHGDVEGKKRDLVRRHHGSFRISSARRDATAPLRAASIMASAQRSLTGLSAMVRPGIASRWVPPPPACSAAMARSIVSRSSGRIRSMA